MLRRNYQGRVGRSLAILALATYASAGVLGYGLHALWHCEHCPTASACCDHGHCQSAAHCSQSPAAHDHEHAPASDQTTVAASHDDCSICSFLAQAQTSVLPRLAIDGVEPLADAPQTAESLVLSLTSEAPLARGPPRA